MKAGALTPHSPHAMERATHALCPVDAARPLDVAGVHAAHADFVWASLQRLGVRDSYLEDLFQEVFVVVHARLRGYEGRALLTTWLFGICVRVVAAHRRRAYVRRERPTDAPPERTSDAPQSDPEQDASRRQDSERLHAVLDELDLEKRAVLVMAELEEMSCEQIAAVVGVPVGTVYSRLHAARRQFEQAVARERARDRGAKRR